MVLASCPKERLPSPVLSTQPLLLAADFGWWLIFVGDWLNARVDILARAMVKAPCWVDVSSALQLDELPYAKHHFTLESSQFKGFLPQKPIQT